ncbi:MAG: imidazolonepropionase, partial [Actinobacteria bacterium]|nr:imidazolonepropionase [Actinomycetota bacterium]
TTSMPLAISLGVISMHMTCDEALWAATAGGARALRRDDVGVLKAGARADLVVLDAASHIHLAYRPGVPQVGAVVREGRVVAGSL